MPWRVARARLLAALCLGLAKRFRLCGFLGHNDADRIGTLGLCVCVTCVCEGGGVFSVCARQVCGSGDQKRITAVCCITQLHAVSADGLMV